MDSCVEAFAGLLSKNVNFTRLSYSGDDCDCFAHLSTIGGSVLAENLHND